MKYVLFFSESGEQDLPYIGKKGVNLALLFKKGFKIPPGFILSREVFELILKDKKIKAASNELSKCSDEKFDEKSEETQSLIKKFRFPEEIEEEIMEAYMSLFVEFNMDVSSLLESEEVFVGIRHSYIGEEHDEFRLSQKTILNIKGKERLLKAILETYGDKLVQYTRNFREHKIKHEFSLALIVQKMVNAEKSGIAYPEGENIIIKAFFGLGHSLGSGSVFPDEYKVDREKLIVGDINIADKQYEYVKDIDSDETIRQRLGEKSTRQVLFDTQIVEVARILKKANNSFGRQQQIEWSIKGETIYVMKTKDKREKQQETVEMEVYEEEKEEPPEVIDISDDLESDLEMLEKIEEHEKESPEEVIGDISLGDESPEVEEIKLEQQDIAEGPKDESIFSDYKDYDSFSSETTKTEETGSDKFSDLARMNAGNTVLYCYMSIKEKLKQRLQKYASEIPEDYDDILEGVLQYESLQEENDLRKLNKVQKEFLSEMKYPSAEEVEMALRLMEGMR